ncbi:uncharacterized protein LOC111644031 [Copidosoma floridanum]|uniref:uncharacterized protein LOC111644031 n=1 Tax=Copidosoma floridanum TaxID=29053 RepID=UPI000C6FBC7B|nr:uncharacterized protein LOC111644031 [Copidosoma floridanum]
MHNYVTDNGIIIELFTKLQPNEIPITYENNLNAYFNGCGASETSAFESSQIPFNSTRTEEESTNSSGEATNDPDFTVQDSTVKDKPSKKHKKKEKVEKPNPLDKMGKINCEGLEAPNYDDITVTCKDNSNEKRVRIKHLCPFCGKDQVQLKRHLKRKHKNNPEVIKMLNKTKTNAFSREPIKKLLYAGDYIHNVNAVLTNNQFRVARVPTKENHEAFDYLPCSECKRMVLIPSYTTHSSNCLGVAAESTHDLLKMGKRMMPACHQKANDILRQNILVSVRRDSVYKAIIYDELLIEYGNEISFPENSLVLVGVIEKMANNGHKVIEYLAHPTVAQNLYGLIKAVTNTHKIMCIKENDQDSQKRAEDFLLCIVNDYKRRLSRVAAESHGNAGRHKIVSMPSPDEINIFLNFINDEMVKAHNSLKDEYSYDSYIKLAKLTLTSLQSYNRRRPGDVERILKDDWKCLKKIDESIRTYDDLHEGLQDFSRQYALLTTRGKLGRDVQLLVTPQVQICVELLLENRCHLIIHPTNNYLFGLPQTPLNKIRHLSAYIVLRKFAIKSGIQNPLVFTATKLRKQLAMACIKMNLNDAGLLDLARYMGHSKDVHISNYRTNIVERDIPLFIKFINTALTVTSNESEEEQMGKY